MDPADLISQPPVAQLRDYVLEAYLPRAPLDGRLHASSLLRAFLRDQGVREDFMASRGGQQLRGQWKRKGDDQASPKCANRFGIQGEGYRCAYACICMCVCVCGYFAIDF